MIILKTIEETKAYIKENKMAGKKIGLVPTMGYLHEGHLTLMRTARAECDLVVVSIFVNPIQFGENEDYDTYPRDLSRDSDRAKSVGVDAIFAPAVADMYPRGYATFVEVTGLTEKLCGAVRPGHFKGVTTVVNKLFNIIQPDIAYFGQKDAQQVLTIQRMVSDLHMNLEIKVVEIVRESDGLAMSSRNSYLSGPERKAALVLFKSLNRAKELINSGEINKVKIVEEMRAVIEAEPLSRIDYIDILRVPDLAEVDLLAGKNLIALAVYIGQTRLIDNIMVEV